MLTMNIPSDTIAFLRNGRRSRSLFFLSRVSNFPTIHHRVLLRSACASLVNDLYVFQLQSDGEENITKLEKADILEVGP